MNQALPSAIEFLVAKAIRADTITACFEETFIHSIATHCADGHHQISYEASVKLRGHYGSRFKQNEWRRAVRAEETKIRRERIEEAARIETQLAREQGLPDAVISPRDYVLAGLRKTIERCMQAEPVLDRDGAPTGQYTFQAMPVIRAFELYGKEHGMFIDRSKIDLGVKDALERATQEDIAGLLADLDRRRQIALANQKDAVQ
jgi:hypothetical protein